MEISQNFVAFSEYMNFNVDNFIDVFDEFFIFHESYKWRERGLISIHSLSTYKTCDQADD